jgi:hypothetical protein
MTLYSCGPRKSAFQIAANWVARSGAKMYFVIVGYQAVAPIGAIFKGKIIEIYKYISNCRELGSPLRGKKHILYSWATKR